MTNAQDLHLVDEPEMGYGQLFNILLRRIVWFGGAMVAAVAIAIVMTLREEPTYRSSMQLLVEPNYRQDVDIAEGSTGQPSLSQVDYATQLNLMRSNIFVQKTIEQLSEEFPDLCRASANIDGCVNSFQSTLNLSQLAEGNAATRIFEATLTGQDPIVTQTFLETLGKVYLAYNEEQQTQRLQEGLILVDQQIEEVENNWASARETLRQFREAENLLNPEQQGLSLAAALEQLAQTETDAINEFQAVQAQYLAIQRQLTLDPQSAVLSSRLSQSSRYQQLLNALQVTQLGLAQQRSLYTTNHPNVQILLRQRDEEITLLQQEVVNILGTLPPDLTEDETALLGAGQMGGIDLNLVSNLVDAQIQLRGLAARQAALRQAQQQLRTRLSAFPGLIAEYERIQPEIDIQQQSLEQLLQLRQELSNELAQGGFNWDIVTEPKLGRQIAPQPQRNLLLGMVAGAFVGGALAFGRDAMDNVVRTSDQLKKQAPLPLLGVLPVIPARQSGIIPLSAGTKRPLTEAFALNQWKPFRDGVDLIYKTIQLTSHQSLSSLMVTSALAGEGKTTFAIGLAVSAARTHQRVLLIDANWRHPSVHNQLGLPNQGGLSTRLRTRQPRPDALTPVSVPFEDSHIDVLTAGPVPDDPVRFLSSRQMRQLLAHAESTYDLVVVDAPAMVGLPDGLQLASLCKGVMLVSRLDRITQADLTAAVTLLRQVNTIGMVANGYRDSGKLHNLHSYSKPDEQSANDRLKLVHPVRSAKQ